MRETENRLAYIGGDAVSRLSLRQTTYPMERATALRWGFQGAASISQLVYHDSTPYPEYPWLTFVSDTFLALVCCRCLVDARKSFVRM